MEHNFITTGERSDMDTKKLREILENLLLIFKHREYTNIIKSDEVIDQAIKEIQELSTPRLTEWEKILPKKKPIQISSDTYDRMAYEYNQAIDDCLSAIRTGMEGK